MFHRPYTMANIIIACLLDGIFMHIPAGLMTNIIGNVSRHTVCGQGVNVFLLYTKQRYTNV